jgi:predicted  nucleic acid-binding Zn-ribbon protein
MCLTPRQVQEQLDVIKAHYAKILNDIRDATASLEQSALHSSTHHMEERWQDHINSLQTELDNLHKEITALEELLSGHNDELS